MKLSLLFKIYHDTNPTVSKTSRDGKIRGQHKIFFSKKFSFLKKIVCKYPPISIHISQIISPLKNRFKPNSQLIPHSVPVTCFHLHFPNSTQSQLIYGLQGSQQQFSLPSHPPKNYGNYQKRSRSALSNEHRRVDADHLGSHGITWYPELSSARLNSFITDGLMIASSGRGPSTRKKRTKKAKRKRGKPDGACQWRSY